jgi:ATP-dependent Lon protease
VFLLFVWVISKRLQIRFESDLNRVIQDIDTESLIALTVESFNDQYFTGIDFDLSRSLIIFSYNDEDNINPILRDRMVKIHTDGYKMPDKIEIAHRHLIPDISSEFGYAKDYFKFETNILKTIINKIQDEEGVRNLRRAIHDIISNLNLVKLLKDDDDEKESANPTLFDVTEQHVAKYVATPKSKNCALHLTMYS